MNTQTIFQAGNSIVVAIPKHIARDFKLDAGHQVVVDKSADGEAIVVKPVKKTGKTATQNRAADKEFQKWLNEFMEENGEILDELATR